jgi:hypothetical protein
MTMKKLQNLPGFSDHAVQTKTGKTWAEWVKTLDAIGARRMSHKETVAHLRSHYLLTRWWQQRITIAYEQARTAPKKGPVPRRPSPRPASSQGAKSR